MPDEAVKQPYRLRGGFGSFGSVAETVRHQQGGFFSPDRNAPGIPADVLPGLGNGDRANSAAVGGAFRRLSALQASQHGRAASRPRGDIHEMGLTHHRAQSLAWGSGR